MNCLICGLKIKPNQSGRHLKLKHNITGKEYYDSFLKKELEGICLVCGKPTKWIGIELGYNICCSILCSRRSEVMKNKSKETRLRKYGDSGYTNRNKYKETCLEKFGMDNIFKTSKFIKEREKIFKKKYGHENPINTNIILKNKRKDTMIKLYGTEWYSQTKEHRYIMESKYRWSSLENYTEYEKYNRMVWLETNKFKEELFKKWNGFCYYSSVKLLTNTEKYNNPLYATIDHKISISYGFQNGIGYEVIGNINNLCICSRSKNSQKCYLTEEEYMEKYNVK